jgi:ribosomal protein S27AE
MPCDRGIREPEDIYGNGGSGSYRIVTDHISCPRCGCEMGLMEVTCSHWLNHCGNCDYTEER